MFLLLPRHHHPIDHRSERVTSTLITGANKGLGFETARRLIAEGHSVYVGSRDAKRDFTSRLRGDGCTGRGRGHPWYPAYPIALIACGGWHHRPA
jgi:hypothetical protein